MIEMIIMTTMEEMSDNMSPFLSETNFIHRTQDKNHDSRRYGLGIMLSQSYIERWDNKGWPYLMRSPFWKILSLYVEGLNIVIHQIILMFILLISHVIVSFLQTIGWFQVQLITTMTCLTIIPHKCHMVF